MKNLFAPLALFVLLCGCSQKSAELERRVQKLEAQLTEIAASQRRMMTNAVEERRDFSRVYDDLAQAAKDQAKADDLFKDTTLNFMRNFDANVRPLVAAEFERQMQARGAPAKPTSR